MAPVEDLPDAVKQCMAYQKKQADATKLLRDAFLRKKNGALGREATAQDATTALKELGQDLSELEELNTRTRLSNLRYLRETLSWMHKAAEGIARLENPEFVDPKQRQDEVYKVIQILSSLLSSKGGRMDGGTVDWNEALRIHVIPYLAGAAPGGQPNVSPNPAVSDQTRVVVDQRFNELGQALSTRPQGLEDAGSVAVAPVLGTAGSQPIHPNGSYSARDPALKLPQSPSPPPPPESGFERIEAALDAQQQMAKYQEQADACQGWWCWISNKSGQLGQGVRYASKMAGYHAAGAAGSLYIGETLMELFVPGIATADAAKQASETPTVGSAAVLGITALTELPFAKFFAAPFKAVAGATVRAVGGKTSKEAVKASGQVNSFFNLPSLNTAYIAAVDPFAAQQAVVRNVERRLEEVGERLKEAVPGSTEYNQFKKLEERVQARHLREREKLDQLGVQVVNVLHQEYLGKLISSRHVRVVDEVDPKIKNTELVDRWRSERNPKPQRPFHEDTRTVVVEVQEPIQLCRGVSDPKYPLGAWLIPCGSSRYFGPEQISDFLALPDSNRVLEIARIEIPRGTKIVVGGTGPIRGETSSKMVGYGASNATGGGNGGYLQFFIDDALNGGRQAREFIPSKNVLRRQPVPETGHPTLLQLTQRYREAFEQQSAPRALEVLSEFRRMRKTDGLALPQKLAEDLRRLGDYFEEQCRLDFPGSPC